MFTWAVQRLTPLVHHLNGAMTAAGVDASELPVTISQLVDFAKTPLSIFGKTKWARQLGGVPKHASAAVIVAIMAVAFGSRNEEIQKAWFGAPTGMAGEPNAAARIVTGNGRFADPQRAHPFVSSVLTCAVCAAGVLAGIPALKEKKLFGHYVPELSMKATVGIAMLIGLNEVYGGVWRTKTLTEVERHPARMHDASPLVLVSP